MVLSHTPCVFTESTDDDSAIFNIDRFVLKEVIKVTKVTVSHIQFNIWEYIFYAPVNTDLIKI